MELLNSPFVVTAAAGLNVGALTAALVLRIWGGALATRHTAWLVNISLGYLIVANAGAGVPFDLRPAYYTAGLRIIFLVGYLTLAWALVVGVGEAIAFRRDVRER